MYLKTNRHLQTPKFVVVNLKDIIFRLRLYLLQHLPIKKNRIVFLSHLGKTYACNPRYLCEYLALNYPGKFDLVWIYDKLQTNKPNLPKGVRAVPFFSYQGLLFINTAGLVVSNTRISKAFFFKKRKGQRYIQTWHSSLRLKCIEADANLGSDYEAFAVEDSKKIDVIFSGGTFSSSIFRNSFWYSGEIIESGTPRIDWLANINPNIIDRIYLKSGLSKDCKYMLYAPTFRKGSKTDAYLKDFDSICQSLNSRFGGNWKILYRLHPNLKGCVISNILSDNVIDMTDYDDIQELLAICQILVTDYSSSMFDALLSKKTCMLYACDFAEYIAKERRLYFDIESLPFPLAHNENPRTDIIASFDPAKYQNSVSKFMHTIGNKETGHACESISKYILAHQ